MNKIPDEFLKNGYFKEIGFEKSYQLLIENTTLDESVKMNRLLQLIISNERNYLIDEILLDIIIDYNSTFIIVLRYIILANLIDDMKRLEELEKSIIGCNLTNVELLSLKTMIYSLTNKRELYFQHSNRMTKLLKDEESSKEDKTIIYIIIREIKKVRNEKFK